MEIQISRSIFTILLFFSIHSTKAEVDPNFYIYLCFGQSNMVGAAQWESYENEYVDERFMTLATTDFDTPKREMGEWYTSYCPIVRAGRLGPIDYFGRTMVAVLPAEKKVGVVAVAISGAPIDVFDKDKYESNFNDNPTRYWTEASYLYYGGNPYGRLIDMARKAQERGVIKGILLHQGCGNRGDANWPYNVKKIYNDILGDLGLDAEEVPLYVGELLYEDMGGSCYIHNEIIAKIPEIINTGHVVSAKGLPANGVDRTHFSAAGYRIFGKRYAFEILNDMGFKSIMAEDYEMPSNLKGFFTPVDYDDYIISKPNTVMPLKLICTFADGHQEEINDVVFSSSDFQINDATITVGELGSKGVVHAAYTDFFGVFHELDIRILVSEDNSTGIKEIFKQSGVGHLYNIYGYKVDEHNVPSGLYIKNRRKIVVK